MSLWRLKNSNGTFDLKNDFNFSVESHVGTGMPPMDVITTEFGLADGSLAQRIVVKERAFKLIGVIAGNTLMELRANRQALIDEICRDQVVSETAEGIETITPVVLQYELNMAVIEINALYRTGLEGGAPEGTTERLTVEFLATDPFWQATEDDTVELNVNSTTAVSNGGTTAAYPVLTLEGEADVLSLENQTTGLAITFDGLSLVLGETITLDLRPGEKSLSSTDRGNLNGLIAQGTRLTTWKLGKGNNTLLLSADGDAEITDESGAVLTDENGDDLLSSSGLAISLAELSFRKRHWSIDGVMA